MPAAGGAAIRTCSTLSVLLMPVVAGEFKVPGVQSPTKGITNGRNSELLGATIFRLRLLTSLGLRESETVRAAAAGSVQQRVARIGEMPSQTNE